MTDFPSAPRAVDELINDSTFAGRRCIAYSRLPGDFLAQLPQVVPVLIYPLGGTEGYVDRTDRVGVDVYAHGTDALDVAEAIRARLRNDGLPHDLVAGYIDDIAVETLPVDVPYATPPVSQAQAVYRVTTRPL